MRSRNIKPGFVSNEFLIQLGWGPSILFASLWMMADRRGVLEDRPGQILIKSPLYAFGSGKALTPADCHRDLDQLQKNPCRFIKRYEGAGLRLIKVLNFRKHQNPHVHEKAADYPDFQAVGCESDTSTGQLPEKPATNTVPATLIPDSGSLIPDSGFPSKTTTAPPAKAPAPPPPAKPPEERRNSEKREFWQPLYAHVYEALKKRKGAPPLITEVERGILRTLYTAYRPWTVMALWDLWMEPDRPWSKWAFQRGHAIAAFHSSVNALLDDSRWRDKANRYEKDSRANYQPKPDEVPINGVLNGLANTLEKKALPSAAKPGGQ